MKRLHISGMHAEKYVCPFCDWNTFVYRPASRLREIGHKKWMYCFKCKRKRNLIHEFEV